MQSFSQHGQDTFVYERFFKDEAKPGFFVDIGAYDGVTFSNSLFFERHLGWRGICVEPLPSAFESLKASRPGAACVNCAVAERDGVGQFADVDMPQYGKMYSGLRDEYDPRHMDVVKQHALATRIIDVPTRRLSGILDEHGVTSIDYLSIDTEGGELKILRSIDLKAYRVRVISVENNYRDAGIPTYLIGQGYRWIGAIAGFDDVFAK